MEKTSPRSTMESMHRGDGFHFNSVQSCLELWPDMKASYSGPSTERHTIRKMNHWTNSVANPQATLACSPLTHSFPHAKKPNVLSWVIVSNGGAEGRRIACRLCSTDRAAFIWPQKRKGVLMEQADRLPRSNPRNARQDFMIAPASASANSGFLRLARWT